jgi:hypothetical protein
MDDLAVYGLHARSYAVRFSVRLVEGEPVQDTQDTNEAARAIQEMVRFFLPQCADQSTLRELDDMASDDRKWQYAHALFRRIRDKTLRADAAKDNLLQRQYSFEEICAKTLYNMSGHIKGQEFPDRFDDDSPFWVIPIALEFAWSLGIEDPCSVSPLLRPRTVG